MTSAGYSEPSVPAVPGLQLLASGKPGAVGRGAPWLRLAAAVRGGGRPANACNHSRSRPQTSSSPGKPKRSTSLLTPPKSAPHLPGPRPRGRIHISFSSRAIPIFESTSISVTLQIYPHHSRTPSYLTAESHLQLYRPSPPFRLVAL